MFLYKMCCYPEASGGSNGVEVISFLLPEDETSSTVLDALKTSFSHSKDETNSTVLDALKTVEFYLS